MKTKIAPKQRQTKAAPGMRVQVYKNLHTGNWSVRFRPKERGEFFIRSTGQALDRARFVWFTWDRGAIAID